MLPKSTIHDGGPYHLETRMDCFYLIMTSVMKELIVFCWTWEFHDSLIFWGIPNVFFENNRFCFCSKTIKGDENE